MRFHVLQDEPRIEPSVLPRLLFSSQPVTVEDAYGQGLPEAFTDRVKALLGDNLAIFDVIEGQRLMQVSCMHRQSGPLMLTTGM